MLSEELEKIGPYQTAAKCSEREGPCSTVATMSGDRKCWKKGRLDSKGKVGDRGALYLTKRSNDCAVYQKNRKNEQGPAFRSLKVHKLTSPEQQSYTKVQHHPDDAIR